MHYTIIKTEKTILCFFTLIALFISCTNTKTKEEQVFEVEQTSEVKQLDSVQIEYANTINNYKVSVEWYPKTAACGHGNSVRGKGKMLFTHTTGSQFEVVHDNFYLIDLIPYNKKNGEPILSSQREFIIEYIPYIDTTMFINTDLPFLFYDTNFDGKKELVLIHPCFAQRFRDYLAVYAINDQYTLVDSTHQITDKYPYRSFDSYSKFNKQDKTVTLHLSGGAATYEERIYKRNKKIDKLQLERVHGADGDSTYIFQRPFGMSVEALMSIIGEHDNYFEN